MNKKLMQQAKDMMNRMEQMRNEVAQRTVEATVGGGIVKAVARGDNTLVSIHIEPEAVDPQDVDMLQDMIVAAVNEAMKKAQEMMGNELGKLTGGLKIPGLM
ncbi:YbaB/EbfC family nucleoid-associated protein [bacterium]|nr:YbaB/EbfC family nucleoid-associated protein [candidate division CSSED10-310 bacterium]